MRNAFANAITEEAAGDERIILLSGDIGNRLFDEFKQRYPNRFLNCGVAEANMIGVAAGMAMSGLRPFVYTIAPFVTARVLEQVRIDVCYHSTDVTIVGVGAGLSYASLGGTHHSCEDIAMMRALPGMTVVCPGDPVEVALSVPAVVHNGGPTYLRLGKKGEPAVHATPPRFKVGRAIRVLSGKDICFLSTGNVLPRVAACAERLGGSVSCSLYSVHTVKPLDHELLSDAFDSHDLVVTVEEHSLAGGFGSSVSEWLADQSVRRARLLRVGTRDEFIHEAGDEDYMRAWHGVDLESIVGQVNRAWDRLSQDIVKQSPGA